MTPERAGAMQERIDAGGPGLVRVQRIALGIGLGAGLLCAIGAFLDPAQFFKSYLVAFVYWLTIPLGCFGLMMLHHLSGGAWGIMIRRILEASSRTLPVIALFFVPIVFGLQDLYRWARPEVAATDHHIHGQAGYLNVPFFLARAAAYFVIWCGLALWLSRLSQKQDEAPSGAIDARMQRVSAVGIILFGITITLASIDWIMSLDSTWFSSIYGFYVGGGAGISALAFTVLVLLFLSGRPPLAGRVRPAHFHDYGKLLLAFVVLWAYFGVSQLIIIWQGQIPEETSWYEGRLLGSWRWVTVALILLHFALPFFLLLSRNLKRDVGRLARVAVLLLVMRWVDLFWLAAPALSPDRFALHWLDLAAPLALGGVWIAVFTAELARRPLLPRGDPHLEEALAHE